MLGLAHAGQRLGAPDEPGQAPPYQPIRYAETMNRGAVVDTCRPKGSPGRTLTLSAKPSMARAGPAFVTCQSTFPGLAFSALTSNPTGPPSPAEPSGVGPFSLPLSSPLPAAPFAQPATAPRPAAVAAAPVAIARNRRLPAPSPSSSPGMCS